MSSKFFKRMCLAVVVVLVVSMTIIGCGKNKQERETTQSDQKEKLERKEKPETSNQKDKYDKAIDIRFGVRGTEDEQMPNGVAEVITKEVKEKYNVNLILEFMDRNTIDEKINVMIAGNQEPDIFWLGQSDKVIKAIESKRIIPFTDAIQEDPVFSTVDSELLAGGHVNGEQYVIVYLKRIPETLYYRVDWAEKLDLKEPNNADELYDFLYAFAHSDPDGNGIKDTYGFSSPETTYGGLMWNLFLPTHPSSFYLDESDDIFKHSIYLADDVKQGIEWFAKAYAEGVMDKEFMLLKNTDVENKFVTGKTGVWQKGPEWILPRHEKIKANFPDAEITSLSIIQGNYVPTYTQTEGSLGGYVISSRTEDPDRAKKVALYYFGPEGAELRTYGIEGQHYVMDNGKIKWIEEDARSRYNPGEVLSLVYDMPLKQPEPVLERNMTAIEGYQLLPDITQYASKSEQYQLKAADIQKIINENITKMIIGDIPISKYDDMIANLKKTGLDDVLADINAIYREDNK